MKILNQVVVKDISGGESVVDRAVEGLNALLEMIRKSIEN